MSDVRPPEVQYQQATNPTTMAALIAAWLFVGIPLAYGVAEVFIKALALFE